MEVSENNMAMRYVLREQDLYWIYESVFSVASKWYNLGLALELDPNELDRIKTKQQDSPTECLREMLRHWLSKCFQSPTREKLIAALCKRTVGYEELANDLEEKYRSGKIQPTTEVLELVARGSRLQQTSSSQQSFSPANKPVEQPATSHKTQRNVCESVY